MLVDERVVVYREPGTLWVSSQHSRREETSDRFSSVQVKSQAFDCRDKRIMAMIGHNAAVAEVGAHRHNRRARLIRGVARGPRQTLDDRAGQNRCFVEMGVTTLIARMSIRFSIALTR